MNLLKRNRVGGFSNGGDRMKRCRNNRNRELVKNYEMLADTLFTAAVVARRMAGRLGLVLMEEERQRRFQCPFLRKGNSRHEAL